MCMECDSDPSICMCDTESHEAVFDFKERAKTRKRERYFKMRNINVPRNTELLKQNFSGVGMGAESLDPAGDPCGESTNTQCDQEFVDPSLLSDEEEGACAISEEEATRILEEEDKRLSEHFLTLDKKDREAETKAVGFEVKKNPPRQVGCLDSI
uniref:Uncharacterized protein n=1 Tax=Cacopsylla melanoneura TaxID=428564 RepID=A0A8D8RGM9_9HEMI